MTDQTIATTLIAILDLSTSADDRPAAVAQLESERPTVRAMPGCLAFRIHPSIETDTDLSLIHEWADESSFRAYLGSDAFARSGQVLRPLLTGPPVSRRFRAELIETVG